MKRIQRRPIYKGSYGTSNNSDSGGGGGSEVIIIEKPGISGIVTDDDFYLTAGNPVIIGSTNSYWARITINSSTLPNSPRGSIIISKNPDTGIITYSDNSINEIYVTIPVQKPHISIINRTKEKKSLAKFLFEWDGMNISVILSSESDEYNGAYHITISTNL